MCRGSGKDEIRLSDEQNADESDEDADAIFHVDATPMQQQSQHRHQNLHAAHLQRREIPCKWMKE